MLTPLLKIYASALKCGEFSLTLEFEMLANMISSMDRSSIASYDAKIFEQCILALDLRHQLPESIKDVNMVEENVIHAIITLTMKLTETMFRPLFFRSLEWADSQLEGSELRKIRSIDRSISFYKLVHKLIEHHRSLFVPYFKYLVDGCTHYLSEDPDADVVLAPRRKKAKVGDTKPQTVLSSKLWHLRSLILKCLYKCFLYDSSEQKFLDSSNFQVLLKPIVSQFVVELPTSLEPSSDAPSVEEVNELIVVCLGQMAVTSRSDVLWQPLNHEVLMQTRSEKVRARILGLRVVDYLLDHLKEEYLSLMAQTVPFLAELLEDVESSVKSLAQEILKKMETLSGENIRQYL
ncbi:hypothetical protein J5N97_018579 [Dioscorea zingiberensis]|uniref:BP28 C-terminal domain-containing protein n=1 Tax=Dioscorea zingiberensis TaxID=325984 RepID=A0A9D5HBX2_9LILI|nr:hypothetical protein J5N97_018579 [Dioscorea zingiberensis]